MFEEIIFPITNKIIERWEKEANLSKGSIDKYFLTPNRSFCNVKLNKGWRIEFDIEYDDYNCPVLIEIFIIYNGEKFPTEEQFNEALEIVKKRIVEHVKNNLSLQT